MKEKKIIEIVKDSFRTIDRSFQKIIKEFDNEEIHDFRVEIKKLRAFLKLLNAEKEIAHPLIPKLLKSFYDCTGIIRNFQLHRQTLYRYINDYNIEKPGEYFKLLDKKENYYIRQAGVLVRKNKFDATEKEILKQLPVELEKSTIKKFLERKLEELKEQLKDVEYDVAIHNIRKILKDILYLWDYIKNHKNLPAAISNKEKLKLFTDMLGDFMDKCIQLEFLAPNYLNKIAGEAEKNVLEKIKEELQHEKQIMLQELKYNFDELRKQL